MITMTMRVEELARRAQVTVDTVRFYQKEGLLAAPRRAGRLALYSEEHLGTIGRIKELQRQGFTLAIIRRLLCGALDPSDQALASAVASAVREEGEDFLTAGELAARSSVPRALLDAIMREGLLVPRLHDGEERFTAQDAEAVSAGLRLLETGFPLPELLGLARFHHQSVQNVAAKAVEMFDTFVRQPLSQSELPAEEKAERLVEAFRSLLPAITGLVAHHFRRVLLRVAQEHLEAVGEPEEIAAARVEARRRIEVAWPS
jgi:DNA-binding transcriptional MerR regulator